MNPQQLESDLTTARATLAECAHWFAEYVRLGQMLDENADDSPEERQPGICAQTYAWERLAALLAKVTPAT